MSLMLVCPDFETYYDNVSGYTLSKMTTEAYVRDPRMEPLCVGIKVKDRPAFAIPQPELKAFLQSMPWDNIAAVFHHAQFDALILWHVYGIRPKFIIDTLSMARALNLPRGMSLSLASLSKYYGLPEKTVPYNQFIGKRWNDMDGALQKLLCDGAARDAENTLAIAEDMLKRFPREELISIDWTVRCYSEPQLMGNVRKLYDVAANEAESKTAMLNSLGLTRDDLASNAKFAAILTALGEDVEQKVNSSGKLIPAVAKADSYMKGLLEHPDSLIVELAETRLAVKSTQRETRAVRMADSARRGPMPVYYYFCGAQNTTRHSGGDKMNWQNMERKGPIRECIEAPAGHKLVIIDLSQIECRILNAACGQDDVVEMFKNNVDIYCRNASMLYGFEVNKQDHPLERGTGKQIELSCGYGCGDAKFQATAALGIYGPPVKLSLEESHGAVMFYRDSHPEVVMTWHEANDILKYWGTYGAENTRFELMGLIIDNGLARLPSGLCLDYRTVTYDNVIGQHMFHHQKSHARQVGDIPPDGEAERWQWYYKRGYRKIYGAKMVEQLTQALAAVYYRQCVNRVYIQLNLRPAMSSHDEAVYVVPAGRADELAAAIHKRFTIPPKWLPNLPVAAETIVSEVYSK